MSLPVGRGLKLNSVSISLSILLNAGVIEMMDIETLDAICAMVREELEPIKKQLADVEAWQRHVSGRLVKIEAIQDVIVEKYVELNQPVDNTH